MPKTSSEALEAARMNPERSLRTGQGSALQGILVNGALGAAKLAAGLLGHSYALVADAAESFADVHGLLRHALRPAQCGRAGRPGPSVGPWPRGNARLRGHGAGVGRRRRR